MESCGFGAMGQDSMYIIMVFDVVLRATWLHLVADMDMFELGVEDVWLGIVLAVMMTMMLAVMMVRLW